MNIHRLKDHSGNAFVDYLMIIAVVAGVGVPVIMNYFGEPILKMFNSERGRMVEFIAQTPKRSVPNIWFGTEGIPNVGGDGDLPPPGDLPETGDPGGGGDLPPPGELKTGKLRKTKDLKVGKLGKTGDLSVGSLPEVGKGGGGGTGFEAGGGQMNPDFFSGGGKKEGDAGPSDSGSGRSTYRSGRGFGEGGEGGGGGGGRADIAALPGGGGSKKGGEEGQKATSGDSKSRQGLSVEQKMEEEKSKFGKFDWWVLMKILIVLFILFLLVLILLSNLKRR